MSQFRATNSAFWRRELVTKLIQNPSATSSPTAILQIRSHGITDGTSNVPGAPQDPSISEIRPLRRSELLEVFNHHYQGGALLKKYWLDRISCSYQHQVAKAIRDKLSYLKGQRYCQGVFENRPNYINEYESVCLPISN